MGDQLIWFEPEIFPAYYCDQVFFYYFLHDLTINSVRYVFVPGLFA